MAVIFLEKNSPMWNFSICEAMMIECMAGKAASIHGGVHDASPFQYDEDNTAINYFGELLQAGNLKI